jgi:hypothetical protein
MNDKDRAWFGPKRFGYGASWPIAWQGWALLGGYIVAALAFGPLMKLPGHSAKFMTVAGFVLLTIAFVAIARRKTQGGWKWRWGKAD